MTWRFLAWEWNFDLWLLNVGQWKNNCMISLLEFHSEQLTFTSVRLLNYFLFFHAYSYRIPNINILIIGSTTPFMCICVCVYVCVYI